jgi:outer membrane protein assembly factor BamB
MVCLLGTVSAYADDWPQLLGPERDGRYRGEPIRTDWVAGELPLLWAVDVGEGFAGPVAAGGTVYLAHRLGDEDVLDALQLSDGVRVWRSAHPTRYRDDFGFNGGPRATPVVAGDRVFTYSADGVLRAIGRDAGELLWQVDLRQKFAFDKGYFGAASSPLVVGDRLLLNVGDRDGAGVVAFSTKTGAVLWQASNHGAGYSSPRLAVLDGLLRAVFFTREGLLLLDPDSGAIVDQLRWRARINASVNAATPAVIDQRIFLSSSYGTGAVLLAVEPLGLKEIWRSDRSLTNHYATSLHHEGFLYGFHGRQESGPSLRCVRLDDGEVMWSEDRFGAGSLLLADDYLLILRESGELVLVPASPSGYRVAGRQQILRGEARAYPALIDAALLARDDRRLVAVDLRPLE